MDRFEQTQKDPKNLWPRADGIVLMVAGSPTGDLEHDFNELASKAAFIIAVDSGANLVYDAQLFPDCLVGDFDSIHSEVLVACRSHGSEIIAANPHKDKTDLELALELVDSRSELRALPLVIINILGGRLDHELVALGTIARFAHLRPQIVDKGVRIFFLGTGNSELILTPKKKNEADSRISWCDMTVSVVALNGEAVVSEKGMEWELDHIRLRPLDPHGISNNIKSSEACICIHEGSAAVFLTVREP